MNIQTGEQYGEWYAVDDDTYDGPGSPIGNGVTPQAAVNDLVQQLVDSLEDRVDRLLEQLDEVQAENIALQDRLALIAPETSRQDERPDLRNPGEGQDSGHTSKPVTGILDGLLQPDSNNYTCRGCGNPVDVAGAECDDCAFQSDNRELGLQGRMSDE